MTICTIMYEYIYDNMYEYIYDNMYNYVRVHLWQYVAEFFLECFIQTF
jgi:hypothetical protein